jgi:hypothetical protein
LIQNTILVSTYSNVNENPVTSSLKRLDFACNRRVIGIHVDEEMAQFFGREMIIKVFQVKTALLPEKC